MALVCLCRGNFYWPPHTTILFCSIFLDKIVLDTLKSRYHRSAPLGIGAEYYIKISSSTLVTNGCTATYEAIAFDVAAENVN